MGESVGQHDAAPTSTTCHIAIVGDVEPGSTRAEIARLLTEAGCVVEVHATLPPTDALRYDLVLAAPQVTAPQQFADVSAGRLRIDASRRMVYVDESPLRMSAKEFALLQYLAAHPDEVFTREALLIAVWGSTWRTPGSVTEYIRRLRLILEPTGIGHCVVTHKGFGYSFDLSAVT